MQRFGIEIRKAGDVRNLYNDVDIVLRKNGVQPQGIGDAVKVQTVAHSLQKMLKVDGHFSVCTIDTCASVCQICIPAERRDVYRAAHCMNWNEMLPDYRELLVAMVLDDFRAVLCPENE